MRNTMNLFLRSITIGVSTLLLGAFVDLQARVAPQAALDQIRAKEEEAGVDEKTPQEIQKQTKIDKFTQSEAHFQLDEVKKIFDTYPSSRIVPYFDIIAECLVKEAELKNSHYSFYHAFDNGWRTPQDLYKKLFMHFKPQIPVKDFTFLRFGKLENKNAQDFLLDEIEKNGLIDDNSPAIAGIILPVNMAIMANITFSGECTWNYFLENKSHSSPTEARYMEIFDAFGVPHNYIKELMELEKIYNNTKEQTLLQIFVPKDKVDDIGYLSWVLGIPAHQQSIDWVQQNIQGKERVGAITGPAIKKLKDMYAAQGNKNPKYKDMIDNIEKGKFSIDGYLKIYRNKPWKLQNANDISARLVITPDILLNPQSGTQYYSYVRTKPQDMQEYDKKLNAIVEKLIRDKEMQAKAVAK
jgi:hypothetical protein